MLLLLLLLMLLILHRGESHCAMYLVTQATKAAIILIGSRFSAGMHCNQHDSLHALGKMDCVDSSDAATSITAE